MDKIAVMYGAGSIGRGFIGQLFSESGYRTVFIDVNKDLIRQLNERGEYPLRFVKNSGNREITVHNVCGVDGDDKDGICGAIAKADIMATSVGKNILPLIAGNIAEGLRRRWENHNYNPLNIIACENMIKSNEYLRELISGHLNSEEKEMLAQYVGTVETCIGRNVPVMTADLYDGDPLRVIAEDYTLLPVDAASIVGELPPLKSVVHKEEFGFYIRQKLFMYNMAHAVIAYLANMRGIKKLCDAVSEPDIKYVACRALTEVSMAMSAEYGENLGGLLGFCQELLYRFNNKKLGIAVPRLGLDPVRKLSKEDRLVGPALLCEKHGVTPAFLALGIAAGYCYQNEEDICSVEIQEYIQKHGIEKAIMHFSSLEEGTKLHQLILIYYKCFQEKKTLGLIMQECDEYSVEGLDSV